MPSWLQLAAHLQSHGFYGSRSALGTPLPFSALTDPSRLKEEVLIPNHFFPQSFSQRLLLSRSHLYSNTDKATFIFMTAFPDKKGYRTQHQKIHYSLGVWHWHK